jgi:preprotein translocase SecE subunit
MSRIVDYVKAVRGELSHVSWPSRNQAIAYTTLVVGISLLVSFILGAFDFIFTFLLEKLITLTR